MLTYIGGNSISTASDSYYNSVVILDELGKLDLSYEHLIRAFLKKYICIYTALSFLECIYFVKNYFALLRF